MTLTVHHRRDEVSHLPRRLLHAAERRNLLHRQLKHLPIINYKRPHRRPQVGVHLIYTRVQGIGQHELTAITERATRTHSNHRESNTHSQQSQREQHTITAIISICCNSFYCINANVSVRACVSVYITLTVHSLQFT